MGKQIENQKHTKKRKNIFHDLYFNWTLAPYPATVASICLTKRPLLTWTIYFGLTIMSNPVPYNDLYVAALFSLSPTFPPKASEKVLSPILIKLKYIFVVDVACRTFVVSIFKSAFIL